MKDNGTKITPEVVKASKSGLMGLFMKATGKTIKPSFMVD